MNWCADIGVPSGCQKLVAVMYSMVRSLPSASLTLAFLIQVHGRCPHFGQGSFSQTQGRWPQTLQGCGDGFSQVHG